jgi:DNA-binding response OmpR family regulator
MTTTRISSMTRILLITADTQLCATLREVLERAHYRVVEAQNSREGLARAQEAATDIIIVDMLLPEHEGLETIITLRRVDPQVKILALAGGGQTGRRDVLHFTALLGVQRTLQHPVRLQELLEAVRDLTHGQKTGMCPAL